MASFAAGNFDFTLLTTHMRWGKSIKERTTALKNLAEWIDDRCKNKHVFDKDIILMGDFNIPRVGDKLYKAITSKGLQMPAALEGIGFTNVAGTANYDQILHYSYSGKSFTEHGGVVDFYRDDHAALFPGLSRKSFTFQMSDHFPLWVQLDTDIEGIDLDRAIQAEDG
jgi:endonuclease/exonuclease/phosphatase family metal-dependent hydrolase